MMNLESSIYDLVGSQVRPNLYRHFKGGYYIVQSLATVEADRDSEQMVVYQSLQDGRVWLRPLSVFQEEVPEGKPNPTGQKHRFEKVTDFSNQLNLIPTEVLLKELQSRRDCPLSALTPDSDRVWREDYLVGRWVKVFIDEETTVEDFNVFSVHSTDKEAVEKAESLSTTMEEPVILKRTYTKLGFD